MIMSDEVTGDAADEELVFYVISCCHHLFYILKLSE
jgi:hypothetical protein